ncbi:membrane-bound alpha-1,6- mannosyltransferase Initiation-specific [Rhizophlyctis rosea]|nr:membrane-bound alpha-1,6- mannosyltransferase Initiation-specific [Rhizophlyctis rosea]
MLQNKYQEKLSSLLPTIRPCTLRPRPFFPFPLPKPAPTKLAGLLSILIIVTYLIFTSIAQYHIPAMPFSHDHSTCPPTKTTIKRITTPGPIPTKIHQTAKILPSKGSNEHYWMQSLKDQNPSYTHQFYSDEDIATYMHAHLPPIQYAVWSSINVTIQRMDIFRYVVIYNEGGWYFDVDIHATTPITSWIDATNPNVSFIAGLEGICPIGQERCLPRRVQICQWAFGAVQGHPILRGVIEMALGRGATRMGVGHRAGRGMDTMDGTGPGVWTDVILGHLAGLGAFVRSDRGVVWDEGEGGEVGIWLEEGVEVWRVGDVRIYGSAAFAPEFGGIGEGDERVCIRHHFVGSWKPGWHGNPPEEEEG